MDVVWKSNFASKPRRPVKAITAALGTVAIISLATCLWATFQVLDIREALDDTAFQHALLQSQLDGLEGSASQAPDRESFAQQSERIQFFNDLTGPRAVDVAPVLVGMEAALPPDVWASQLSYDAESGRFAISLQSQKESSLALAFKALEDSGTLQDLILDRQVRLQQGGNQIVQFDIQAHTR